MRKKLTDAFIKTLKAPETGRLEVGHGAAMLWASRDGKRHQDVDPEIQASGSQRRMNLGYYPETGLAEARKLARQKLSELSAGKDPAASKREQPGDRFADLTEAYMTRHAKLRNKEVTWKQDEQLFSTTIFRRQWKNRELSTFKMADISGLHAQIGEKSIYAANHTLRLLKSMFNRAAREFGMFSGDNPAVGVSLFAATRGTRFLRLTK